MVFSTLASLCRHHRRSSPKRFPSSHTEPCVNCGRETLTPRMSSPRPVDATVLPPASTGLPTAGISNKWNHALLHCPSVTGFFHEQNVQGASMLGQRPDSPSFASLSRMPLYGETPTCLSICWWTLGLLPPLAMAINTAVKTHVRRPLPASASHLLDVCSKVELLGGW